MYHDYLGREIEDIELDSMRVRNKGRKPAKITRHDPRNPFYSPTAKEAWYFLHSLARAEGYSIVYYENIPFFGFVGHGGSLFTTSLDGITRACIWITADAHKQFLSKMDDRLGLALQGNLTEFSPEEWQQIEAKHPF